MVAGTVGGEVTLERRVRSTDHFSQFSSSCRLPPQFRGSGRDSQLGRLARNVLY